MSSARVTVGSTTPPTTAGDAAASRTAGAAKSGPSPTASTRAPASPPRIRARLPPSLGQTPPPPDPCRPLGPPSGRPRIAYEGGDALPTAVAAASAASPIVEVAAALASTDDILRPDALRPPPMPSPLPAQKDAALGTCRNAVDVAPQAAAAAVAAPILGGPAVGAAPAPARADGAHPLCDACHYCPDVCSQPGCVRCDAVRRHTTQDAVAARRTTKAAKRKRPQMTMCQVARGCTAEHALLAANKLVYDVTAYLASGRHPGGQGSIERSLGTDVSEDFAMHGKSGKRAWRAHVVATLVDCPRDKKARAKASWRRLSPAFTPPTPDFFPVLSPSETSPPPTPLIALIP